MKPLHDDDVPAATHLQATILFLCRGSGLTYEELRVELYRFRHIVSRESVFRAAQAMVKDEWLETASDEADIRGRRHVVRLTAEGFAHLQHARTFYQKKLT